MPKSINDIPYLEIFKKSWGITWKNKFLWWFGFFIALSSGAGSFNNSFNFEEKETLRPHLDSVLSNTPLLFMIILIVVVFLIVFILLGLVGRGAIIKSVYKMGKGEKVDYKSGFKDGKKYFVKLLLLAITLGFFVLAAVLILCIPIIILFANKAYIAGTILSVIGIVTIIPVIILISFTQTYGYMYTVLADLKFWPAIENGYELFLKNIFSSVVMALLFIPLGILLFLAAFIVFIPFLIFFIALGLVLYAILSKTGIIIAAVLGIVVFLIILLLLRSVYETFVLAAWTLFFQEIASPEILEKALETAKETEKENEALQVINPVKTYGE